MGYPYNPNSKVSGPDFNFYDAVTLRQLHKAKSVAKLGANTALTTTQAHVWSAGVPFSYLTSAETLSVVSASTADTSAGTGAQTLAIIGLDANGVEITDVVTMNGTTPVLTSLNFYRVNEVAVFTAGSGSVNAGAITVTGSGSATVVAHIAAGVNRARQSHYTVPANRYLLVRWVLASSSKNSVVDLELFEQLPGRARVPISALTVSDSSQQLNIPVGAFFSPGNTVLCRAATVSGTGSVTVNYVGYLVDSTYFDADNPV